jgi:hypothetical protein
VLAITEEHVALAEVVREFATKQGVRAADRAALDLPRIWATSRTGLWK